MILHSKKLLNNKYVWKNTFVKITKNIREINPNQQEEIMIYNPLKAM